MKNRISKSLAFSAILMMLLSTMAIFPVLAQTDPEFYLVPSDSVFDTSTTSPCYKFNITLMVKDLGTPVWAWQVKMNIIPAGDWINITRAWTTWWDPTYIFYMMPRAPVMPAFYDMNFDNCSEGVLIGDSLSSPASPVTGSGPFILGIIELHLVKAPAKYETFSAEINIDNDDTYLLDDNIQTITPVIKTDGSVTYDWSPPTTDPYLEVIDPADGDNTVLFDQDTEANWTAFDVEVWIKNLDLGWAITNASFVLKFNTTLIDVMGGVANITINTADWDGPYSVNVIHAVPDRIEITVRTTQSLAGDVLIATIKFTVQGIQQTMPPFTDPQISPLDLQDIILYDHIGRIPTDPAINGEVVIYPLRTLELPWFEVVPEHTVLGPELVICEQYGIEFDIAIDIKNLDFAWKMVGFNMRFGYDPAIVEIVDITEGPFMQDPTWNVYGTYPIVIGPEPANPFCPTEHYILADMILPNPSTGEWDQPEPEGEGTVFIITVKPLVQSWVDTIVMDFDICPIFPGEYMVDEEAASIPVDECAIVDGDLTILPISPIGRRIDVWFINPPNGGYGLEEPADLVLPQTEITLTAKVTYNWWHVQYKKVTFEVRDNNGALWGIFQDDTDDEGHAYTTFRMPWPCEGAEDLLGKWTITVSVTLADVVITDWVIFDYDYLVRIWKVTTDKLEYAHCEDVEIEVEYGTHAMREEDVILAVTITDELGVPIGVVLIELTVGGAEFCTYMNYTTTVTLHVDKFAYAGLATVHASFLSALPSEGGEAVAQEVTTTFWILPH